MRIIDAHTHLRDSGINFSPLYDMAKRLNYERLTVLSLQSAGLPLQNLLCALCKRQHPGTTYAFGGLDYKTERDFRSQVEHLYACGFDGIKMIEGKPTTRRVLNRALNDPVYDSYYSFCEEKGFPILLHVADPGTFWDKDKVPSWALEHGWYYNENDVPYNQYYEEVDDMLRKHPKLRAIFAHFYFLSGDPERLQKFLDSHPNIFIDVTAGIEMYEDFSKDPVFWREFFIKNQNRIIFGTDSMDTEPSKEEVSINGYAGMEIDFLKFNKPLEVYIYTLHGIGLPEDTQRKIFSENYLSLVKEPRPLDLSALAKEAEMVRGIITDEDEKKDLEKIMKKLF
jgi:predicted TIM-barrel fold metal-dependent hydrolase